MKIRDKDLPANMSEYHSDAFSELEKSLHRLIRFIGSQAKTNPPTIATIIRLERLFRFSNLC